MARRGVLVERPTYSAWLRASLDVTADDWAARSAVYGGNCFGCVRQAPWAPSAHIALDARISRSVDLPIVTLDGGAGVGVTGVLAQAGPWVPVAPFFEASALVTIDVPLGFVLLAGLEARSTLYVLRGDDQGAGVGPTTLHRRPAWVIGSDDTSLERARVRTRVLKRGSRSLHRGTRTHASWSTSALFPDAELARSGPSRS